MTVPREAKIFIFWGQSNMSGVFETPPTVATSLYPISIDRVLMWNTINRNIQAYYASFNSSTSDNGSTHPQGYGPEAEFIRLYHVAHPNDLIYIMKHSIGATALGTVNDEDTWFPADNELFAEMTAHVRELKSYILLKGYIPVVQAIIGMQGERDANFPSLGSVYRTNKNLFYVAARDNWSPENLSVKFIDGRINVLGIGSRPAEDDVREGQVCSCKDRGATAKIVNTDDLTTGASGVHFDAASQIVLGARMYDAFVGNSNPDIIDDDAAICP